MSVPLSHKDSFVIKTQTVEILKEKLLEITDDYNVELVQQFDPNTESGGVQWVLIKGRSAEDVEKAKAIILAICNPTAKQRILIRGFPIFIFNVFGSKIKRVLQRKFGAWLLLSDDGFINIHGEELGVALMYSKIHSLSTLSEKRSTEETQAAAQFDRLVRKSNDEYAEELYTLSNVLKRELLEIMDIPMETTVETPVTRNGGTSTITDVGPAAGAASLVNLSSASTPSPEGARATASGDLINLCDSAESDSDSEDAEYVSDDDTVEDDAPNSNRPYTGEQPALPPNFAIKDWMKIHYEGTSNPVDYVNKTDLLLHFQNHFDLPDHPELANTFFDKLAVRIFPADSNYRNVKTKRTKSKHSKRRLVCLRRKTVVQDDILPRTSTQRSPLLPTPTITPSLAGPVQSSTMREWNEQRSITPVTTMSIPASVAKPVHTVPYQITQHHSKRPSAQTTVGATARDWVATASPPQPVPVKRTKVPAGNQTLAKRVANMTNEQLVSRQRPPVKPDLRPVVIDGSNVAITHGCRSRFSCRGIALCIRYFLERGHGDVICMVPNYRLGGGVNPPATDHHLIRALEDAGWVKLTPSRKVNGRHIVCYDDRFIIQLAESNGGVIVSNDQYRDIMETDPDWKPVIQQQLLQFTLVGDLFMFPNDPQGRHGPSLENFLKVPMEQRSFRIQPERYSAVPGLNSPQRISQPPWMNARPPPVSQWDQRQLPEPPRQALLNDRQSGLVSEMAEIFPEWKGDFKELVLNNPHITDINDLMNLYLRIHER